MKKLDIHNYDRRIECRLKNLHEFLKTHNGKALQRFVDYLWAKGYSKARILKYLEVLPLIDKIFKKVNKLEKFRWEDATREQMIRYAGFIESNDEWSPDTKMSYRTVIKRFYRWLEGNDKDFPDKVNFMISHVKEKDRRMISPDELVTEEEMIKIIDAAEHPRDKAFVSLLCESGCRIGEAMSIRIKNLKFDDLGCLATIEGKTGQRTIRLISSTPYLATWVENHPMKKDRDAPLFVNYQQLYKNKLMGYQTVRKLLRKLYEKAGVNKKSNPHLLRHSRASILAGKDVLGEFQLNQHFGWVHGGKMAGRYLHLNCKSTEDSLLKYYGIREKAEEEKVELKPKTCPRCSAINSVNGTYCIRCGGILDAETAIMLHVREANEMKARKEADNIMNSLMKDPDVRKVIIAKLSDKDEEKIDTRENHRPSSGSLMDSLVERTRESDAN